MKKKYLILLLIFCQSIALGQDKKIVKIVKYIEKGKDTEAKEILDELDTEPEYQADIYYWFVRTIYYRNAARENSKSTKDLEESRKSFEKLVELDKKDPSKSFSAEIPKIRKELYEGKNQISTKKESDGKGSSPSNEAGKFVTLTLVGEGRTKEEAKNKALRNALEQAFGTYISSNTTLINDELQKDEIVSITNGNVQSFEILSETQLPGGGYSSVVKSTVAIGNFIKFCESKGITVEFKGALFAANIKLQELNRKNEESVMHNLFLMTNNIVRKGFNFEIVVNEPKQKYLQNLYELSYFVYATPNENLKSINTMIINILNGICLSQSEIAEYDRQNRMYYKIYVNNKYYAFRSSSSLIYLLTLVDRKIPLASLNFEIITDSQTRSCVSLLEKSCIRHSNWTPPKWQIHSAPSVDKIAINKNIIGGEYLSYDKFSLLNVTSVNHKDLLNSYTSYSSQNSLPKILLDNLFNGYEILYQFQDIYDLETLSKITSFKIQPLK